MHARLERFSAWIDWPRLWPIARRLLIAVAAIVTAMGLFRFALLPLLLALFEPAEATAAAIRRTGIFLCVLLAYWLVVHRVERRPASELRVAPAGIALAAVAGAGMISLTTLLLFATGAYGVVASRGWQSALSGVAAVILVAAFLEEVLFRGVLFRLLEEAWGTTVALWLQSLVFAVMHLSNVAADAAALLVTTLAVTLLGALWACLYVLTRNLWIVGAHHAAWNFAIVLSGAPLSGLAEWRAAAPVAIQVHGPAWLTGGAFGPENSVATIALVTLAVAGLLRLARARGRLVARRGEEAPPPAA